MHFVLYGGKIFGDIRDDKTVKFGVFNDGKYRLNSSEAEVLVFKSSSFF